jgi:tRNA1Val (adenine37-N6)-methyltransferase
MVTRDAIFGGRVLLEQPGRGQGYRVNADALYLADFAGKARGLAFDLGAGVGAVALVMMARGFVSRAVLVDDDGTACKLALKNASGCGDNATVIHDDVLDAARGHPGRAALVVCNPPYFEPGTARTRRDAARARVGAVERFVRAARVLLGRKGRACFVYPASDVARLVETFRSQGLEPKRQRFVHPTRTTPARVVLMEVRASKAGGLVTQAPLVEREGPRHDQYTSDAACALGLA